MLVSLVSSSPLLLDGLMAIARACQDEPFPHPCTTTVYICRGESYALAST